MCERELPLMRSSSLSIWSKTYISDGNIGILLRVFSVAVPALLMYLVVSDLLHQAQI